MKTNSILVEGFTDRLEEAIFASNLSLSEICRKANISRPLLWNYRFGNTMPQAMNLLRIALALNVSTDWLLGISREEGRRE